MKITTVELDFNHHGILVSNEITKWLTTYIGPGVKNDCDAWRHPDCQWSMWVNHYKGSTVFEFKNPEHAVQFRLAWG